MERQRFTTVLELGMGRRLWRNGRMRVMVAVAFGAAFALLLFIPAMNLYLSPSDYLAD